MSNGNPSLREWFVGPDPQTGEVDPEEVAQMAIDTSTVQRMCGGTLSSGAAREQDPQTGEWLTIAMWWRWHPFAPALEQEQPQQPPAQQPQQAAPPPARKRKRNRRNRGGNGQPPAPVPSPVADQQRLADAAVAALQVDPEPQEPPEAFFSHTDDEEERPEDEFKPLTEEEQRVLAEEGLQT
jgi:hypothetical protein